MTVDDEMLDLRAKTQSWVEGLIISGMEENAAIAAINVALIERALRNGGPQKTAEWLRSLADLVEENGDNLLRQMNVEQR